MQCKLIIMINLNTFTALKIENLFLIKLLVNLLI